MQKENLNKYETEKFIPVRSFYGDRIRLLSPVRQRLFFRRQMEKQDHPVEYTDPGKLMIDEDQQLFS